MEFSHARTVPESLREYGRGVAGGLMFSLPLLFTMEVWWTGFVMNPERMLMYVGFTFLLLLAYNRFAGLRRDASWREVMIDSVEEMGIGVVLSVTVLFLCGQIHWQMPWAEVLGKIIMESMAVAIGVSVGTAQLGTDDEGDSGTDEDGEECAADAKAYLPQTGVAMCGAVLFAANVAPTDEVRVIATEIGALHLLGLATASLVLTMLVLQFAAFRGADAHVAMDSSLVKVRGIVTTYAVALLASAALLWFFGQLDEAPFSLKIALIVVLGVPATLGASAGRLLLQTASSK
jgi:putative integral membrane protein (TIGR02587 family)